MTTRQIKAVFWDVGGVILTNGWDEAARDRAIVRFGLEQDEVERRHTACFGDFETGLLTLNQYLDRVVFFRERAFAREEFLHFLFAQSTENRESRQVLDELTAARCCLNAALNNEGLELNVYRIRQFGLTRNFDVFLSSCYLGKRKPDPAMYETALGITQRTPSECVFIDDRPGNLVPARQLGMHVIHFESAEQLRGCLAEFGLIGARV